MRTPLLFANGMAMPPQAVIGIRLPNRLLSATILRVRQPIISTRRASADCATSVLLVARSPDVGVPARHDLVRAPRAAEVAPEALPSFHHGSFGSASKSMFF